MVKLYEHQKDALEKTKAQNRVAYYHDMGLGKTFTGSEKMIQLGARINLVVCQKSKVQDWVEHFSTNYNYEVFNLTVPRNFRDFMGLAAGERYNIVGVINYDLVWRRSEVSLLKNFTLLLDESSLIQHKTSKRTKFIMKKLSPKNVILLSGTPTGGKYENLLTQIHLLGWSIREDVFWNQYVDWEWQEIDGFFQKKINGYKNVERLKRKLREHGCHFLKTKEVINLPEQVDQTIYCDIIKEYKKFHKDDYVEINDEELIGDSILNKMLRERQLCGQYNANKLESFRDLLESTEDRVIVFYNFNEELAQLKHISDFLERDSSIVSGRVKDLYAYENKNDSVTFLQYQAGAMGLNLQKANKIIYFTPPLSSELFEQSKKRIHRIGQNKTCFYYYLVCKNSIEEKIYSALATRRDYTEELFKEEK